jgi:multiple sugar transport system substrate-binding protein
MFEALSHEFQRKCPDIAVEVTANSRAQDDEFLQILRRALIRDLPDVSFQGFTYLGSLMRRRIVAPLNDFIRNDPEWSSTIYSTSLTEIGSIGQSVAGLGAAVSVPIVFYDENRLAEVLGSPNMPHDWDSMLELVRALSRRAKPRVLGAFCQHDSGNWIFSGIVEGLGGSLMTTDERRIAFDQLPGRKALEIYRAFGQAGQAWADMDIDQARQAFVGGAIALLIDSSSNLPTFERQIGGRFRLGSARLPVVPTGRVPVSGVASVLLARDSSRQAAAWKFMKFVSGPEGQQIIGKSSGYFPANRLVASRPEWLGNYYASRRLAQPVIETLPQAGPAHRFPGENSAKIDSAIADQIASVVTLSKTPDQALAAMKHFVEALLPVAHREANQLP